VVSGEKVSGARSIATSQEKKEKRKNGVHLVCKKETLANAERILRKR